ncbi:hypothetical protein RC74_02585 [Falsihalocynthiibacter arcticus]|uniref:Uncharacterized protein n=1 Tax=Falsihalocynthiibacter arcticus TaxID=1579316 RepID=A0A126UXZ5_9RHOB|nr:hypothetical protein RC74_02585 [Falsihalocynthiibacter arcticus]
MKQINSILLFAILFGTTVVFSGLTLAKGGMYLGKHESDILHLLDILQRLRLGGEFTLIFKRPSEFLRSRRYFGWLILTLVLG